MAHQVQTPIPPSRPAPAVTLAACLLLAAGCANDRPPTVGGPPGGDEGYIAMDDGVRLYYRVVGSGAQVVVVPVAMYLAEPLERLALGRRLVFYDPRNRGASDAGDLASVSLERQVTDLEQLRQALDIEQMALIGWSGLGMEMAVYALRYPDRVSRLVQVSPVPPAARIMAQAGDRRADRIDRAALAALDEQAESGAIDPASHCRGQVELILPANFVDPALAAQVPEVCMYHNEWPANLGPYFDALLGSFGDYDWRPQLKQLAIPRLVIHGREDGVPLAGARAWAAGYANARLLVLSPAGHFPFIERADEFFPAVDRFLEGQWPPGANRLEASADDELR